LATIEILNLYSFSVSSLSDEDPSLQVRQRLY